MPTIFTNEDNFVAIKSINLANQIGKVPAMVYALEATDEGPILVKDRDRFAVPKKVYGKLGLYNQTILDSYNAQPLSTGVLLNGKKGAGKSLLAEMLGNEIIKKGLPVILINRSFTANFLKPVISAIGPCMVYFDEFGKLYEEADRAKMLPLFSDSSFNKVMFVLTSNDSGLELNDYMLYRPGRFKFKLEFRRLDELTINEVLASHDLAPEVLQALIDYTDVNDVSFDILQYVAKEGVSCKTTAEFFERLEILNVPPAAAAMYVIEEITYKGKPFIGEVILKPDLTGFSMELRNSKGELEESEKIDWMRAIKQATSEHRVFRVTVNENLILKLRRNIGGPSPLAWAQEDVGLTAEKIKERREERERMWLQAEAEESEENLPKPLKPNKKSLKNFADRVRGNRAGPKSNPWNEDL